MDYLLYEQLIDAGQIQAGQTMVLGDDNRVTAVATSFSPRQSASSYASSNNKSGGQKEYWKGNAPVLEKVDYNNETIMVPKMAPRDEPQVTIRKAIYERAVNNIENHQGGPKVNYGWRTQVFNNRMQEVAPALLVQAKTVTASMRRLDALNVFVYSDATLYGNTTATELTLDDPADANGILAASRAACRWIGMTLTFHPQQILPDGNLVERASLPSESTMRIYFRAPLQGGGLSNAVTKAMVTANPDQIFRVFPGGLPQFMGIKQGNLPQPEVFNEWMNERFNQVLFSAMKQIAYKAYIGEDVATDTLKQRFHKLGQRKYNAATRKNEYLSVSEFHSEMLNLVAETDNMEPAVALQNLPELDAIFYHGLISRLRERPELARMTNHAPSASVGENIQRLQDMVNAAKVAENEINQIVSISMGQHFRRTPIAATGGGDNSRTFLSTDVASGSYESAGRSPARGTTGASNGSGPSATEEFALTMLSNAERALRESSNSNAPLKCWGCEGAHLYKDCPRRHDTQVQQRFKAKLEEFLANRKQKRFDPSHYKRDGFFTKKAAALFNDISNEDVDKDSRLEMIKAFVAECNAHGATRVSNRKRSGTAAFPTIPGGADEGDYQEVGKDDNALALPFWVEEEDNPQDSPTEEGTSFNAAPRGIGFSIRYPITVELPHIDVPVGKQSQATAEGLLDTGGACTMGDLAYWSEVAKRMPELIAHFEELADHQEKPITIGGVGAGRVMITHVMGLWLPWTIGSQATKLVIGLGEGMPMTLLIGLPFQVSAQCVIDIGNQKCYSQLFGVSWKVSFKRPMKKDLRMLDATMATGKRYALATSNETVDDAHTVSPSPKKKVRWSWETEEGSKNYHYGPAQGLADRD